MDVYAAVAVGGAQLINLYGEEAQIYLIKCLVEETDAVSQQEAPDVQKVSGHGRRK